jgi:hypothetical protein
VASLLVQGDGKVVVAARDFSQGSGAWGIALSRCPLTNLSETSLDVWSQRTNSSSASPPVSSRRCRCLTEKWKPMNHIATPQVQWPLDNLANFL